MLTKGAIGNLINRYKAVLTKCNLINVFGSLAVAAWWLVVRAWRRRPISPLMVLILFRMS